MKTIAGLAVAAGLMVIAYWFAWGNYQECREAGQSVRFCVMTHLVR